MLASQAYLSPAATPNSMMQSPLAAQAPTAAEDDDFRLRAEIERTLLKISQDLYELEVCAGDVSAGQEDRVPLYMSALIDQMLDQS
jgi:mediator of RNA polymerase II transcription subunit 10